MTERFGQVNNALSLPQPRLIDQVRIEHLSVPEFDNSILEDLQHTSQPTVGYPQDHKSPPDLIRQNARRSSSHSAAPLPLTHGCITLELRWRLFDHDICILVFSRPRGWPRPLRLSRRLEARWKISRPSWLPEYCKQKSRNLTADTGRETVIGEVWWRRDLSLTESCRWRLGNAGLLIEWLRYTVLGL